MLKHLAKMPATICILVIWIALFLANQCWSISHSLCGKGIAKIDGDYYRFFTAGLVHTNWIHLLVNGSALFWIGCLYEHRLGSLQFLFIGIICAVVSQVIFLSIFRNAEVSLGGSCYNFALCGFALMLSVLNPEFPQIKLGTWSGNWLGIYLIGANIPFLPFMDWTVIVIHAIAFTLGAMAALLLWSLAVYKI